MSKIWREWNERAGAALRRGEFQEALEGYIAQTFAESFADLEEAAFINGDGSGKPRGFLQDAATGTTASATNAITDSSAISPSPSNVSVPTPGYDASLISCSVGRSSGR